jgi:hypothetical protein
MRSRSYPCTLSMNHAGFATKPTLVIVRALDSQRSERGWTELDAGGTLTI